MRVETRPNAPSKLRQVLEIERNVPLAELRRRKTQLAPGDAEAGEVAGLPQMVKIGPGARDEIEVANTRF